MARWSTNRANTMQRTLLVNIPPKIANNTLPDCFVNKGNPSYKIHMRLTINNIQNTDYGTYKCVAKNPRGETDGTIRLYSEYARYSFHYYTLFSAALFPLFSIFRCGYICVCISLKWMPIGFFSFLFTIFVYTLINR